MQGSEYRKETTVARRAENVGWFRYKNGTEITNTTVYKANDRNYLWGYKNPRWRFEINHQQNATTSLEASSVSYRLVREGWCVIRRTDQNVAPNIIVESSSSGVTTAAVWTTPSNPESLSDSLADNSAKTAFLSKIISEQRAVMSAVVAGEASRTLRTLRSPARALRQGVSDYVSDVRNIARRRGNRRGLANILSNSWLEHRFGWLNFARDVEDTAKALNRVGSSELGKDVRASGHEYSQSFSTNSAVSAENGMITGDTVSENLNEVAVVYRGRIVVDRVGTLPVLKEFGLHTEDFLPTVWELIPYSFLVDYFTNVGDIVNAFSYRQGGLRWSNRTVVRLNRRTVIGTELRPQSLYAASFTVTDKVLPCSVSERKYVTRAVYTGSFYPDFRVYVPGSSVQYLNIGALAGLRYL